MPCRKARCGSDECFRHPVKMASHSRRLRSPLNRVGIPTVVPEIRFDAGSVTGPQLHQSRTGRAESCVLKPRPESREGGTVGIEDPAIWAAALGAAGGLGTAIF